MGLAEEQLTYIYQSLVEKELDKLDKTDYNFTDPSSFITREEIEEVCDNSTFLSLVEKGLLIPYTKSNYRTSHVDLIFRLVHIRNLEEQRPIPLEFKIVKRKELVPDYGFHKFSNILPEIIPDTKNKELVKEILLATIANRYEGLSSYQLPMVKELISASYRNVAMVAPTASGKTLAFFLPVFITAIHHVIEQREGTSSLLIYPRRALERDQLGNFLAFIDVANEILTSRGRNPVTVGIDDSDTPRRRDIEDGASFRKLKCVRCGKELVIKLKRGQALVVCRGCFKTYPYLIPSKEDIWEKKPTILITNIWIVYRRLMSSRTVGIFQELDYVVVDEAHVYTHFLGGHVSYILKMLRYAAEHRGRPVFVFASATIPNPKEFISSLAGIEENDLFYIDFKETLEKSKGAKLGRLLLYLYLLPHPASDIETLSEALILATTLWCHKNGMKGITFIDSIAEINTMRDYLHTTILGVREGREVTDHIFKTKVDPENDYCWYSLSPSKFVDDYAEFKRFVLNEYKKSVQMHYGGLSLEERARIEGAFRDGLIRLLLSTSTLELGIDLSDVAVIIQHKLPLNPEGVVQRVGRSGRDPNCFRIALGIIVLPSLPLSTLYMFDEKLREILENVTFLPPLRVGETSHSLALQYTVSLALLKRALEGKPTYIEFEEGIKTETEVVQALREILRELAVLPEFNEKVKLFDEKTIKNSVKEIQSLLYPLSVALEKIRGKSFDRQSEQLGNIQVEIETNLTVAREAEDLANELWMALQRLDMIPKELRDKVDQTLVTLKGLTVKLSDLRSSIRLALENKEPGVIKAWLSRNQKTLEHSYKLLPNKHEISQMILQLTNAVGKIGFEKFSKVYGYDFQHLLTLLLELSNRLGTGEKEGLLFFLKEIPEKISGLCSMDLDLISAFQSFQRFKNELRLTPWARLDIFQTLNLLLEGKAYFSLLLQTPSPDLELVGVEEV